MPARTYLGSLELVVDPVAIRRVHANWPSGELAEINGAKHELLMEVATVRDRILDETISFFRDSNAAINSSGVSTRVTPRLADRKSGFSTQGKLRDFASRFGFFFKGNF